MNSPSNMFNAYLEENIINKRENQKKSYPVWEFALTHQMQMYCQCVCILLVNANTNKLYKSSWEIFLI